MRGTVQQAPGTDSAAQRRRLRAGLVSAGVLSILLAGLILGIPDLRTVAHRVAHARWGWVALAAGLELASCVGYVLVFQQTFWDLPRRFAALVAASEQAFGAVVPVGGAGGIAAGGWLLARREMPVRQIAERSAVLFLLTSATNVVALLIAAAGLALGLLSGPHDPVRTVVPAVVALSVLVTFLALACWAIRTPAPRLTSARSRAVRRLADTTVQTLRLILGPGWRVGIGAPAYLLCDVAVLWLTIRALGYDTPAAPLLVAYLLGYLANAIPIPGGLGVLDSGLAGALIAYHVPASPALGGVLVYHVLALWIPTASGTLAFIAAQRELAIAGRRRTRPEPLRPRASQGRAPSPPNALGRAIGEALARAGCRTDVTPTRSASSHGQPNDTGGLK